VPAPDYTALAAAQRRKVTETAREADAGGVKRALGAIEAAARDAGAP